MITVRPSQTKALEAEQIRRFERDAVQHVRERLPQHYEALGEHGTLEAVRQGIAGAKAHGLETRLGITVYVRLAFVFGLDFADQFAWAEEALADRSAEESARVERLSTAAAGHARALASGQEV